MEHREIDGRHSCIDRDVSRIDGIGHNQSEFVARPFRVSFRRFPQLAASDTQVPDAKFLTAHTIQAKFPLRVGGPKWK